MAAVRDGDVLYEALLGLSADGSPGHTTRLLGEVERAAQAAGGWEEVDGIAAGVGPGSFTGLRVGIASARALAASLGIPATGVCTLDAIGRGIERSAAAGRARLAVLDARRGEAFAALYGTSGERLWGPWVGTPGDLAERLRAEAVAPLAAGSGAVRFRDELVRLGAEVPDPDDPAHRVSARHVCALAEHVGDRSGQSLAPIYLRPPDAERWRERHTSKSAD